MTSNDSFPLDTYLPHMRDVGKCEQALHELNLMWRMIESSAKMNCPQEARAILPTMAATRAGFAELEQDLVLGLVRQKADNACTELATKAQYVIDIVVRNLYERTADVGFLATDRELCSFVAGSSVAGSSLDADAMRARLCAYRSKYTVYDEIMLLDTAGKVLLRIDPDAAQPAGIDPLIAQTLASDGHVDTFRFSALQPGKRAALIYSRRMHDPYSGAVIGVLCLCFAFEEEMERIFRTHGDGTQRANLLLLDANNRVIASADPLWIPLGALVPVNPDASSTPMMYAGRQYLVRTHACTGYQGYPGPAGWQGQTMMPLDVAFANQQEALLAGLDPEFADGWLSHAESFCPPLFDIMQAAETIRRVVWNGQVMTAGQHGVQNQQQDKLKAVLDEISDTGARSNELFALSIRSLFDAVLASGARDVECVSSLLVDLLERNLYERANDCRWWVLAPELRSLLASAGGVVDIDADAAARIARILERISSLYTVYTCIVVYDRAGVIVASSAQDQVAPGASIDAEALQHVLALHTEQDYWASPFEASALYQGQPTYVYHAAIRSPDDGAVIGGIGIVFDAGPEFSAMLRGALGQRAGVHAFFVDRTGMIIASLDPAHPIGTLLDAGAGAGRFESGGNGAQILTHDGQYAIMAAAVGRGYREFNADGVSAIVIDTFGQVCEPGLRASTELLEQQDAQHEEGPEAGIEFATFFIGIDLFALKASHVAQALPASKVARISVGASFDRIGVLALPGAATGVRAGTEAGADAGFIWVFDLGFLLSGQMTDIDAGSQVVVVQHGARAIGLLVSELHGVAKFDPARIIDTPLAFSASGMLVPQLIKANQGRLLLQVVDIDYLFGMLSEPQAEATLAEPDCEAA